MSGLMQLRDALELMEQADAYALSLRLPQAMLKLLEMMGQAERVTGCVRRRPSPQR